MEGPSRSGRLDQLLHLRPESVPRVLMHLITVSAGQQYSVTEQKAAHQGRETTEAADCHFAGNDGREGRPGVAGGERPIGYRQDRNQPGVEWKAVHFAIRSAKHQSSVDRGCGVVGMILHVGGQIEHCSIVNRLPHRPPGGRSTGDGRRRRRAQTPPDRDPVVNDERQGAMLSDRTTGRFENAVKVPRGILGTDVTHAPEVGQGRLDDATEL